MPHAIQFTDEQRSEMIQRYESGRESCRDLAVAFGCAGNTIRANLMKAGVRLDGRAVIAAKASARPSPRRGTTHNIEARLRMSVAQRGNKHCLGRRYSSETIAKMRRSALRRCASAEARERLQALSALGAAARHADRAPSPPREPRARREKKPRVYRRPEGAARIRARQRARYKNLLRGLLRRTHRPKTSQCAALLGYSNSDFVRHIEVQFQPGMSWAGRESFHVDHIIPLRVLIAHGVTDPRIVNALCNLRPLPPRANRDKGDRYDESRWATDYAHLLRILAGTGYEPVTSL